MTLFFSCLRCKKIAVTPLDESGRCYAAVRLWFVSNIEHSVVRLTGRALGSVKGSSEAAICDFGIFSVLVFCFKSLKFSFHSRIVFCKALYSELLCFIIC